MDRLFLAVPLTDPAREAVSAVLSRVLPGGLPGRVVPPENWHLTLRFLGDTDDAMRDRVVREMESAELGEPYEIGFGRAGAFPRASHASVLWLGVSAGEQALASTAVRVEEAARGAGFAPEPRPFAAHLTLSRLRPPADVRPLLETLPDAGIRMEVREVVLYGSELGGGAPRYRAVARFPLG